MGISQEVADISFFALLPVTDLVAVTWLAHISFPATARRPAYRGSPARREGRIADCSRLRPAHLPMQTALNRSLANL